MVHSTATLEIFGKISSSISSRLASSSVCMVESPVTLPPGLAKLFTSPLATGSDENIITTGIDFVAFFAAREATVPAATMRSTLRSTSSAAASAFRRSFPQTGTRS